MVYRLFSYLYPRALRTRYVALLGYAHIKVEPLRFLGFILFFGLGLALALAFFVAALFPVPFWRIFLSAFVIFEVGF